MTSFVIADTLLVVVVVVVASALANHSEAASLWLVRQDRATINSGSPPSCGANFCSDQWLHRPRWVGWPVRYLDIYLFCVYECSLRGVVMWYIHFGPWSLRSSVTSVLIPKCTSISVFSQFGPRSFRSWGPKWLSQFGLLLSHFGPVMLWSCRRHPTPLCIDFFLPYWHINADNVPSKHSDVWPRWYSSTTRRRQLPTSSRRRCQWDWGTYLTRSHGSVRVL